MRKSTRLCRKSRRGAMPISRPTILKLCRIWWPLRRFAGLVCVNEGGTHSVVGQEILRNNPIAIDIVRAPVEDDVLPLTKPITGVSGKVYTELPIPKGTSVSVSTIGYNMYVFLPTPHWPLDGIIAGIRVCGVQTLTNSDRSGGSK